VQRTIIIDLQDLEIRSETVRAIATEPLVRYGVVTTWLCGRNVISWSCKAEEVLQNSVHRVLIMRVRMGASCVTAGSTTRIRNSTPYI
jgi:hypothetical protein